MWVLAVLALCGASFGQTQEEPPRQGQSGYEDVPEFGGNISTGGQLKEDAEPKQPRFQLNTIQSWLEPYFDWKRKPNEKHGLSFGMDYTAVGLWASDSPGEDEAASGMFRLFGNWTATGRGTANTGSVIFKLEHRHRYTAVAPKGLGFETGYVGLHEPPFNNDTWRLTNLYWMQRMHEGHFNLLGGLVDVTDYVDVNALANPWTGFFNFAFSTGSATIPVPNDGGLGGALGAALSENFYTVVGIADTNADPTQPGDSFESFFDDSELFSHVELGWFSSYDRRYLDNAHLTLWHADEREATGDAAGSGVNFSWSYFYQDKWMPFVRGGWTENGGSLLERSLSAGFGYQAVLNQDLLGIGLNWGRPNSDTFGPGLDDQFTAEVFYRVQFSENFAITPDLQFISNPALNPDDDTLWMLGLRVRLGV